MAVVQGIDRRRIDRLSERESARFADEHPRSAELLARGSAAVSVPAAGEDIDRYLGVLADLIEELTA